MTQIVVATAIVRNRQVLAQQRAFPSDHAGRWEFPGGRVEAGESETDAVVRECREELGVDVVAGAHIGPDVALGNGMVLRLYTASLADDREPVAVEHSAVRWIGVEEFDGLPWLEADLAFLPDLRELLSNIARTML